MEENKEILTAETGAAEKAALEFDYPEGGFSLELPESFNDIIGY